MQLERTPMLDPILQVKGLGFHYRDKPVFSDVYFEAYAGDLIHIRGANGAGKTTLLKLIAKLLSIQHGDIIYQADICYVGHALGLSRTLSIREHYRFECLEAVDYAKLLAFIEYFGLTDVADKQCGLLSHGQRRRGALLHIFFTQAKLWLLDEPLVALDATAIKLFIQQLNMHRARGGVVLITSHQTLPEDLGSYREYCL